MSKKNSSTVKTLVLESERIAASALPRLIADIEHSIESHWQEYFRLEAEITMGDLLVEKEAAWSEDLRNERQRAVHVKTHKTGHKERIALETAMYNHKHIINTLTTRRDYLARCLDHSVEAERYWR